MKKPQFVLGFELEGLVKYGHQEEFDAGLHAIKRGIDRGTDGSVEGYFVQPTKDAFGYDRTPLRRDIGNGIEIRTPPLPKDASLELFYKILEYLEEWTVNKNFKTNESCGLHVNLSERQMIKTYQGFQKFYTHLICKFPEHDVLKLFNRSNNNFCHPLFTRGEDKSDFASILQRVDYSHLGKNKYHTVAFHSTTDSYPDHIKYRRVEFRCLGNTNYHRKVDKLRTALDLILECATDAYQKVMANDETSEPVLRTSQYATAA